MARGWRIHLEANKAFIGSISAIGKKRVARLHAFGLRSTSPPTNRHRQT
jgi:hypothetical protein